MTVPTLFDQVPLEADQESGTNAKARRTPLEQLSHAIERQGTGLNIRLLHPRDDKLWIVRTGGTYSLTVKKGKEQYRIEERALRQLAALLDVPTTLLEKLAGMPRAEDCRLLNMLMFTEGARPDARFRCILRDGRLSRIYSGKFTSLDSAALVEQIKRLEQEGRMRLRRYEIGADGLWLELEHADIAPIDLSPVFDRINAKADHWFPGAILWNREDGSTAVTVIPVLFRKWGALSLPVLTSQADIRKRRHVQDSPEALLRAVTGDLAATREAAFQKAAERLRDLHERFLPKDGVFEHLGGLNLPLPRTNATDSVVRRVTSGRPTHYRLVMALLHEAKNTKNHARRLRLQLAVGRLIWSGVKRRRKAASDTRKR